MGPWDATREKRGTQVRSPEGKGRKRPRRARALPRQRKDRRNRSRTELRAKMLTGHGHRSISRARHAFGRGAVRSPLALSVSQVRAWSRLQLQGVTRNSVLTRLRVTRLDTHGRLACSLRKNPPAQAASRSAAPKSKFAADGSTGSTRQCRPCLSAAGTGWP